MGYVELLRKLIALGSKLPVLWPKIVLILTTIQEIAFELGMASPEAGTLNIEAPTPEELSLENQVGQLVAGKGSLAVFDGSRLRALWKFMQDTGLDAVLVTLLTKLLAGA